MLVEFGKKVHENVIAFVVLDFCPILSKVIEQASRDCFAWKGINEALPVSIIMVRIFEYEHTQLDKWLGQLIQIHVGWWDQERQVFNQKVTDIELGVWIMLELKNDFF